MPSEIKSDRSAVVQGEKSTQRIVLSGALTIHGIKCALSPKKDPLPKKDNLFIFSVFIPNILELHKC